MSDNMIVKITKQSHPKLYAFLFLEVSNMGNNKEAMGKVKGEEAWLVYDVHDGEVNSHECQLAKMTDDEADRLASGDINCVGNLVKKYHLQDFVEWVNDFHSGWYGSRMIAKMQ